MSTNRDSALAQERDLITEPREEGFFSMVRVDEGKQAVLTLDGRYQETIEAGGRFMGSFNPLRQKRVRIVDMRARQMTVEVRNELTILDPAPMQVQLLSVVCSYRVMDARVVAMEFEHPLGELFDYVVQGMQYAVANVTYRDFLTGQRAGQTILGYLQQRGLEQYLGIQPIDVRIAQILGQESLNTLLADQHIKVGQTQLNIQVGTMQGDFDRSQALQDAINDGDIAKVASLTPALVAQRHPELFRAIFGDRTITDAALTNALIELAKIGAVDVGPLLSNMGLPGAARPSLGQGGGGGGPQQAFRSLPGGQSPFSAPSAAGEWPSGLPVDERIEEEGLRIQKSYGVSPTIVRDGEGHVFQIPLNLAGGRTLEILLVCPVGYPASGPSALVIVDDKQEQFSSQTLQQWTARRSLVDIVDEIVKYHS